MDPDTKLAGNGAHVTWRELQLALKPLEDGLAEIKTNVKDGFASVDADLTEMRAEVRTWKQLVESRSFFGERGRAAMHAALIAIPSSAISALVAFFIQRAHGS